MKLKSILVLFAVLAIAGVVFLISNRPKPADIEPTAPYVWDFNMDALTNIEIILPKEPDTAEAPNHQAWVQHEDKYYYFDVENGTKVDMQRWGGGIPLILSGPGSTRVIARDIPDSALGPYGFDDPTVVINLKLNDNAEYHILVGDATPGGNDYYIKLKEEAIVYTVDKSWYEVLSGLVTKPPYEPAHIATSKIEYIPAAPVANQSFIIRATVVNTGILANTEPVEIVFKFQGDTLDTRIIGALPDEALLGGKSLIFDFNIDGKPAGTYSISITGITAKLVIP